jgi:uncharacterized membrane protein (DUF106 family)
MRKFLLILFFWTSIYFCLPATAVAEEHEGIDLERARQHMEIEEMEMELDQRRSEMRHENQMRELELEKHRAQMKVFQHHPRKNKDKFMPLVLICLVVHILVAIWVFQDIRNRGTGSGIWIVITLLAGLLGALVYTVVRLGDVKQTEQ